MEIAPHVQEEKQQLDELIYELKTMNYQFQDLLSKQLIPMEKSALEKICPVGGSINVLAFS